MSMGRSALCASLCRDMLFSEVCTWMLCARLDTQHARTPTEGTGAPYASLPLSVLPGHCCLGCLVHSGSALKTCRCVHGAALTLWQHRGLRPKPLLCGPGPLTEAQHGGVWSSGVGGHQSLTSEAPPPPATMKMCLQEPQLWGARGAKPSSHGDSLLYSGWVSALMQSPGVSHRPHTPQAHAAARSDGTCGRPGGPNCTVWPSVPRRVKAESDGCVAKRPARVLPARSA